MQITHITIERPDHFRPVAQVKARVGDAIILLPLSETAVAAIEEIARGEIRHIENQLRLADQVAAEAGKARND